MGKKWESCQGSLFKIGLGSDIFTGEFCKTSRNKNLYNTETRERKIEKGKEKSIQINFGEAIDLKKKKAWQR